MKITSSEVVNNFKPIRVDITCESAREMDMMVAILELAKKHAFAGTGQMVTIDQLLPHFSRT